MHPAELRAGTQLPAGLGGGFTLEVNKMIINFDIPSSGVLVIAGPQGCGKTTLAREIAEKEGAFHECRSDELLNTFGLGRILRKAPSTLIIDVPPITRLKGKLFSKLRELILGQGKKLEAPILGGEPRTFPVPKLIICTSFAEPFLYSRGVTCLVLPGAQ